MHSSQLRASARPLGKTRAAFAATTGLLLACALLIGSMSGDTSDGVADGGTDADSRAPEQPAYQAQLPGWSYDTTDSETCYDGSDPTESLTPSTASGESVTRIQEAGELVVGVDQNSYLWGFREPATDELVGFDIDLVHAIAEDLLGDDPEIVFRAVPTADLLNQVRSGQLDLAVRTVSITCLRDKQVAFSAPYFETGQQMLAPRSGDIQNADRGLTDQRVCAGEGTTAELLLEEMVTEYSGPEPVTADNHLDCLVLVQLGEADGLITDSAIAAGHAAQDPTVQLVDEPLTTESYGVAMNRDDEDLVRRVNAVLANYTDGDEDSAWRASYDSWLAEHMETAPSPPDPRYRD